MKQKSIVLLSSGLDSTVNLYEAHRSTEVLLALTFGYGQRAAKSEILSAKRLCDRLSIKHRTLELPFIKEFGKSSLTDERQTVPQGPDVSIDDLATSNRTASSVWVPNRNGIFMNVAAGFAEALGADLIIPGFNKEEAATFPDNTQEFLNALTHSFEFSTANHVKAHCYTTGLNKTDIVKRGLELNVDFSLSWPCYFTDEKWCGQCESCQRAKRAFKAANVPVGQMRFQQ